MTSGETAYLALAIGCFVTFMVAVSWLRADYARGRARRPQDVARLQAQMAE